MQRIQESFVTPRSSENLETPYFEGVPWYCTTTNILLAVLFLPPLGLVLMWRYAQWPMVAKVFATLWAVLLTVMVFGYLVGFEPLEPNLVFG